MKLFQLVKMVLLFLFIVAAGLTRSDGNVFDADDRILFGRNTTIREQPYFASVETDRGFICEGVLVAPNVVFTTAHLTQNKSGLFVRAGMRHIRSGGYALYVQEVHVHPYFNMRTRDYDIAVLILKGSFNFTSKIKPIELVEMDFEVPSGFYTETVGWQLGNQKSGLLTTMSLQRVPCDIPRRTVTSRMHCYAIFDALQRPASDAGAPLILDDKLVGIGSWNYKYKNMFYTIYVKVAYRKVYEFITQFF